MTPKQLAEVERLFHEALARPPMQWDANQEYAKLAASN